MSFAKDAWPLVVPCLAVAVVLLLWRHPVWASVAALLGVALLLFFRIPERRFDGATAVVLAAADGLVTGIDRVEDPAIGPGRFHRIVTFLSVFDVHVQRSPIAGTVIASSHRSGRKVAAFRADAGEVNEQRLTVIATVDGRRIGVRQIAGLIARRVVSYVRPDQELARGQLLGLIKFGSRVDLLIPEDYELLVAKGQRVRTGATPVARPPA